MSQDDDLTEESARNKEAGSNSETQADADEIAGLLQRSLPTSEAQRRTPLYAWPILVLSVSCQYLYWRPHACHAG